MVGFALSALSALALSWSAAASPLRLAKRDPVPSFVLEHAPLSYLYSKEQWWPSDVAVHLTHVTPQVNFTNIADSVTFATIPTLASDVFLTSKDDVGSHPSWLGGIPTDSSGFTNAPATIIVANKANGVTDAFYFYFYSYDHATVRTLFLSTLLSTYSYSV